MDREAVQKVREKEVEKHFVQQIRSLGGSAFKLYSPWNVGLPDRLVMYHGRMYLVEIKSPKGRLTKIQKIVHQKMATFGVKVHVIYSPTDTDVFITDTILFNSE